jgi:hypothetical protein
MSSMVHVGCMVMEAIREQASATILSCPLMYRMSVVNCPMKLIWRICRGEALSDRCLYDGWLERASISSSVPLV